MLKAGCVNGGRFVETEHKALPPEESPLAELEVRPGDLLMSRANTRALLGSVALVPKGCRPRLLLCDKIFRIEVDDRVFEKRFLVYAMASATARAQLEAAATGSSSSMQNIGQASVKDLLLPAPAVSSQRAIADFLDRKTAAIDALIAAKKLLLDLLAEKRRALIAQVVTKGIDRNAAMKQSGVEWLGSIPENWQVSRSKLLFTQRKWRASVKDEQLTASQAYGVIPQREYTVRTGQRVVQLTANFELRKRVERDDFVISMMSFQGGLERAWAAGGIRSSYVVLKPSTVVDVGYFSYLFKSSRYISALQGTALFIRDGQDLTFDNFAMVDLPLPPREEQQRIAIFLDARTAAMDALFERTSEFVTKLVEYRQALITAALTGQLDIPAQEAA